MVSQFLASLAGRTGLNTQGKRWSQFLAAASPALIVVLAATAALAIAAGLVDLAGDGDDTKVLLLIGTLVGLAAALGHVRIHASERVRDTDVLVVTSLALACFVLGVAGLLRVTDTASTALDALTEAMAAGTTTALGTVEVASADHGGRLLIAGAEWLGGLGALLVGVAILPFFGAGREFADRSRRGGRRPMSPDQASAVRHLLVIYALVSTATCLAFWLAGSAPFDSVLLAMATASTGGLAVGARLDTAALEWVAIGGMTLAGTSVVVLWRLGRGRAQNLIRSGELRIYLGLLVVGTGLFLFWTDGSGPDGIRRAAFTVTAALTTTGFPSAPGGTWAPAAPILILGLVSVGPMVGSAGGGLQILRHRILAQVALREMLRQLHPRSLLLVRLGGRVAAEDTLSRVVVTQFLFVGVLFVTAVVVAIIELDLPTALAAAVHATSTAGPVRTLDGHVLDPSSWPAGVRLGLLPAMLIGRLSIYPAFVTAGVGAALVRDRSRIRRRWLARRAAGR